MKPSPFQNTQQGPHSIAVKLTRNKVTIAVTIMLITLIVAADGLSTTGTGATAEANYQAAAALQLNLAPVAGGFNNPIGIVNAGDLRLFVLEKKGVIKIINTSGQVEPQPFLDITGRVYSSSPETGLLGLAFHPSYFANGYFYLNYTNQVTDTLRTRISRFSVTADPNVADPNSEEIILTVDQQVKNHNAGHLMFGRDGLLYIPLGDGGGFGGAMAQDPTNLLGAIVRIDVDGSSGGPPDCSGIGSGDYTVPGDNPLIDGPGGDCDEIWATGFRNPWRSSFDRLTGDLYIGDVGQGSWEEIDYQPAGSPGGQNYGWPCYEGVAEFNTTGCGPIESYTFPIFAYSHADGCSVIGGYVYRGSVYEGMVGRYFLTDFCSGNFWDLVHNPNDSWTATKHTNIKKLWSYTAIGEACDGELYVTDMTAGTVLHLQGNGGSGAINHAPTVNGIVFTPHNTARASLEEYVYLPVVHASWCRPF